MIWVTAEDVVAIHSRIIQVSGGIDAYAALQNQLDRRN